LIQSNNTLKKLILLSTLIILALAIASSQTNYYKFQDIKNLSERSSLASRIIIWKSAEKMLENNPVIGIGPGNFQNKYLEYQKYFPPYLEWAAPQPHNLYLAFWLQSGLLGLIGFLFIVISWIKTLVAHIRHQKNGLSSVSAAILGIMFYILIHGLVDTPYWKNDLSIIFWSTFILGLLYTRETTD
jgi:O-antigen ligase